MSAPRPARFVNVHMLHVLPFSNPNRDDQGAPKSTYFGGVTRGRLSSQSEKRASRLDFEALSDADRTHRSKFVPNYLRAKVDELLEKAGHSLTDAERAKVDKAIDKEIAKLTGDSEGAKATLVHIAEVELLDTAKKVVARTDAVLTDDILEVALSGSTESLTVAAFGRMFANKQELSMPAAVQVAHSFTTHQQLVDLDYFTAADDLQASFGELNEEGKSRGSGAGHLDVNEFHSGVFYRYFNVNRGDLAANWAPLTDGRADDDTAGRLRAFIESMVVQLPTGRDATASHQSPPSYVMVTYGTRGESYATAFESPVRAAVDGGFMESSRDRLVAFADRAERFGGVAHRDVLDLTDDSDAMTADELFGRIAAFLIDGSVPQ